jgi:DNA-binding MarR family transcriptional regulator
MGNATKSELIKPRPAVSSDVRSARATGTSTLEQQVFLELIRVNGVLMRGVEEVLKSADLSSSQFNVLRILRGAGADGLACGEVGGRMITHDPDITRLLDRLESRGLIARERQQEDRRVVKTRITAQGSALLKEMEPPLGALHKRQFSAIPNEQLEELAKLLSVLRSKWESPGA